MKLKHVDLDAGLVRQDGREVRTKFSKTFTTYFFPVGEEARRIVVDWINYLRRERLWGNDDPLFPATEVTLGSNQQFRASGLRRECWSSAGPIRSIFRCAFVRSGLPYFNPHSFRHTLVRLGETICRNPEDFKAWSQNLGHEGVLTTFYSYGTVGGRRQGEILRDLAAPRAMAVPDVTALARALAKEMAGAEDTAAGSSSMTGVVQPPM
jgi:integrase